MKKPGYKTTEFYLTLLAQLIGALMVSGLLELTTTTIDNQIAGVVAMVLSSMGYTASRAWTKAGEAKAQAAGDALLVASAGLLVGATEDATRPPVKAPRGM